MSAWFTKGRNAFATGDIDWINDLILAIPVASSLYTPDYDNDVFISDIPEAARIASSHIQGKNIVDRVATAIDLTFVALDQSVPITGIVLAKDTTDINSSPVFLHINSGTGFPYDHSGEDLVLHWNAGGIFIF